MASQLSLVKSSEGQRRRLFLLELAQGLIMPQVRRRSLVPIVQELIRLAMKMVLQMYSSWSATAGSTGSVCCQEENMLPLSSSS